MCNNYLISANVSNAPGAKPLFINVQTVSRDVVSALGLQVLVGDPGIKFGPGHLLDHTFEAPSSNLQLLEHLERGEVTVEVALAALH